MIKYVSNETEKEASSPWIPNTPSSRNFGIARASSFSLYEHAILLVTGCCLLVFPDWYLQGVGRLPLLNHPLTKINLWTFTSCHDPIKTYATPFACDVEFPALQLLSLRLESLCTLKLLQDDWLTQVFQQNGRAFPGFVCYCMLLIVKSTNGKTLKNHVSTTRSKKRCCLKQCGSPVHFRQFSIAPATVGWPLAAGVRYPCCIWSGRSAFVLREGERATAPKRRNGLESTLCSPEC